MQKPQIKKEYSYLRNIEKENHVFIIKTRLIIAKNENELLFSKCKPAELSCELADSIIVWNQDVIHTCPFEIVLIDNFTCTSNLIFNEDSHLFLQKNNNEINCNINMTTTNEGLHLVNLTGLNHQQLKVINNLTVKMDDKALTDLQLADSDYSEFLNSKTFRILNKRYCENYGNLLKLFKLQNGRFFTINDRTSNELIVYSYNNKLTIPTCVTVSNVTIIKATGKCYKDMAVSFYVNNKKINGFLTEDLIIVLKSSQTDCDSNFKIIQLNETTNLQMENNYIIATRNNFNYIDLSISSKNLNKLNFHHSEKIINGYTQIDELSTYVKVIDDVNHFYIEEDLDKATRFNDEKEKENKNNTLSQIIKLTSIITTTITLCIIVILIIYFKKQIINTINYITNKCSKSSRSFKISYKKNIANEIKNDDDRSGVNIDEIIVLQTNDSNILADERIKLNKPQAYVKQQK